MGEFYHSMTSPCKQDFYNLLKRVRLFFAVTFLSKMNKEHCFLELRPNKMLLDPSFGGYKLSLDMIPLYRKTLNSGVKVVQPGENQFSFSHVKIFSLHNHLYVNPYQPNSVYLIDKNCKVFKAISSPPHQTISLNSVFQIPNNQHQQIEIYQVSIVFASSDLVVLSDGSGVLYLANVIKQDNEEIWEFSYSGILFREDVGCILSDAKVELTDNRRTLSVLLLFVEEKKQDEIKTKTSLFQTKLKWRTFIEENNRWEKKSYKELCINGSVDYIALEPGCKGLYIISDKSPNWIYDSDKVIESSTNKKLESVVVPKSYTWTQTNEDIIVWLPLAKDITKSDLVISADDLQLQVKIEQKLIISGKFFHRVNKDFTTWTSEKDRIEIRLKKHESGLMWKTLIPSDDRGEEILDPDIIKTIHEKLRHLCSDKQETGSAPLFNSQQLEECDIVSCDTTSMFRINGNTHLITHEVSLSSLQWLFKVSCEPNETPAICVRHDVDACVWQFRQSKDEKTWPHEHIGTFSAFGYVQASKTQKKFITSPPNLSYVAVCEASHHIYIYRQPSPLSSELKNRHTGKKVNTISKQQLVNLEAKEQILGVHATNTLLFVLLENSICALGINL